MKGIIPVAYLEPSQIFKKSDLLFKAKKIIILE